MKSCPYLTACNPCGFKDLELTDLVRLGADSELDAVRDSLLPHLLRHLHMDQALSSLSIEGVPTSLQSPLLPSQLPWSADEALALRPSTKSIFPSPAPGSSASSAPRIGAALPRLAIS